MSTLERPASLTQVLFDIVGGTAPPRLRLRDVIGIGRRFRRRDDGMVVMVEQVHRADRLAEVTALPPRQPGEPWQHGRFTVPFGQLAADYDLLVRLEGLR